MIYNSYHLETNDGLILHTHHWTVSEPKAAIIFTHGYCEHAGRYHSEAKFFNEGGINFHSFDQRHHGQSEGKPKSYIHEFNNHIDDLELYISKWAKRDVPLFLIAHSMGGLVLVSYLIERNPKLTQLKGIVLSAPLLKPDKNTATLLQKFSSVVGTLLPKLKTVDIDSSAISRDENEVKKYMTDPLNYNEKIHARSGYQLLKQMASIKKKFNRFQLPLLILHGTDDKLAELEGSETFFKLCSSQDKEMIKLEGFKHEITRDIDFQIVRTKMQSWITERLNNNSYPNIQ